MKIPSLDKIARQVAARTKANFAPVIAENSKEFAKANKAYKVAASAWHKITSLCEMDLRRHSKCTCQQNYPMLYRNLCETAAQVNVLSAINNNARLAMYDDYMKVAMTARNAKRRWLGGTG